MGKVLIACEESQTVCIAFRKLGYEAYSCDLQECSGDNPEWHIQGDAVAEAYSGKYSLMIAHPPCTDLAVSGAAWFAKKIADGRQQSAIDLFMKFANAPIDRICIENPIGIMSRIYQKPSQIIQPYYFGDEAQKTTCLWLKNLPHLYHNKEVNLFDDVVTHVDNGEMYEWVCKKTGKTKRQAMWFAAAKGFGGNKAVKDVSKVRSKTFQGIADAMANQWGKLC